MRLLMQREWFCYLVTEREVIRGMLTVKNTKNHCLAYVRYINNINLQNLRRAGLFIDIANRAVDTEAVKLLANLRDERLPAKIEISNLQRFDSISRFETKVKPVSYKIDTLLSGLAAKAWEPTRTRSTCKTLLPTSTATLRGSSIEPCEKRIPVRRARLSRKSCSTCTLARTRWKFSWGAKTIWRRCDATSSAHRPSQSYSTEQEVAAKRRSLPNRPVSSALGSRKHTKVNTVGVSWNNF